MNRLLLTVLIASLLHLAACEGPPPAPPESPPPPAAATADYLPTPYTAEQIREEWIPGFTLEMERATPEQETRERWTVIEADETEVTIAFEQLDEQRQPRGDPRVETASWVELRDHARFPAASGARREKVTRTTALGSFEGWLYTVPDGEHATVSEFFFGSETPGAPLLLVIHATGDDGAPSMRLEQVARTRPGTP